MKSKTTITYLLTFFTGLNCALAQAPGDLKDETILVISYEKFPEIENTKGMSEKMANKAIRNQNSKVDMNNKYQEKYMLDYPFKFKYITPTEKAKGNTGDAKYIFSWTTEMSSPSMQDVIAQQRKGNFSNEKDTYYTYVITNIKTNEVFDVGAKEAREQVHALKMVIEAVKKQFNK